MGVEWELPKQAASDGISFVDGWPCWLCRVHQSMDMGVKCLKILIQLIILLSFYFHSTDESTRILLLPYYRSFY